MKELHILLLVISVLVLVYCTLPRHWKKISNNSNVKEIPSSEIIQAIVKKERKS